jgi:GNAT superfamily N-acetyltransferase
LTESLLAEVTELYASVFAGPPWYEIKRCAQCNETYGQGDDLERFHDGDVCRRCGQPLELLDYWRGARAREVYQDALARPGFAGMGGRTADGRLVAFSWGFTVPDSDTPSVLFNAVNELLRKAGLDVKRTFYAAETGVDPEFQHQGIGGLVSYARLQAVREAGYKTICFRTINPKMLQVFERFFGSGNVPALFHDPDPLKSNRLWYAAQLADLIAEDPATAEPPAAPVTAPAPAAAAMAAAPVAAMTIAQARFAEYQLIVGDLINLSARRQTTNQVFVALNSLFLTGLGALLLTFNLLSVQSSAILGALSVLALAINGIWWRSLGLYRELYRVESGYAEGIEHLLREVGIYQDIRVNGEVVPFGFISLLDAKVYRGTRRMLGQFERALSFAFMLIYPLTALLIAMLTYLMLNGYVLPGR